MRPLSISGGMCCRFFAFRAPVLIGNNYWSMLRRLDSQNWLPEREMKSNQRR